MGKRLSKNKAKITSLIMRSSNTLSVLILDALHVILCWKDLSQQKLTFEFIHFPFIIAVELSRTPAGLGSRDHPTVAILTCLFAEKQSIDAIIDNSTTVHRYRSGGDSNIYTLGWIGKHRVVATKLAVIGVCFVYSIVVVINCHVSILI